MTITMMMMMIFTVAHPLGLGKNVAVSNHFV